MRLQESPSLTDGAITLKEQPASPVGSIIVVECKGGSDKGPDGHRRDTIPMCNALIENGWFAEPVLYSDEEYDAVKAKLESCNGVIVRIMPGVYEGVTQDKLNSLLKGVAASGIPVMPHPDATTKMGNKDALVKIRELSCGLLDTFAYYDILSFQESFPKTIGSGARVIKQNRGPQGKGIWVCKLKDTNDAHNVTGSTVLELQEAFDNHKEERTVDEFMTFCEEYLVGDNAQLIDQQFLPRVVEGEIRLNMVHTTPTGIVVKTPAEGGISANLACGATYEPYKADDPKFATMMDDFLNKDMPKLMEALGLAGQPLPLIWTVDFILGPKDASGNDTYFVGQLGCAFAGIPRQQLHLTADVAAAAGKICSVETKPPAEPVVQEVKAPSEAGSIVVVECRGGSDKGPDGHRRDTIPICNALIEKGWSAEPIFYSDEEYDAVKAKLESCNGVIVRIMPGVYYEGVTRSKVDDLLRGIAASGVPVMPHPDVTAMMGNKDALVKIRDLMSCGMPDTYAYYDIPSFQESFPKTISSGVRVIKQNRGSQGEGIWVCKLKDTNDAHNVTGSTVLELQEAFDNHKEERTVDEFMTFCEEYLVGDNAQLIDQQFLPRIVEGEIHLNMIYSTPSEIVVKTPTEGGISATVASGAIPETYKADDPKFATMMDDFLNKDMPKLMEALGLAGQPLPLIWTVDFILGPKDASGNDTYVATQFGCASAGINRLQLHLAADVAAAAIKICCSTM